MPDGSCRWARLSSASAQREALTRGPHSGRRDRAPADAFIRYGSVGEGRMLHLGHVHVVVTQCTWLDPATGFGSFDLGTITLTAANGDILVLAHKGTFTLAPSKIEMTWTVAPGGTGRFADATGSGTGHGTSVGAGTPESTTSVWLSGTISY